MDWIGQELDRLKKETERLEYRSRLVNELAQKANVSRSEMLLRILDGGIWLEQGLQAGCVITKGKD